MKKNDFVTAIAEKANVTKKDVDAVIGAMSDVILDVIAQNDSVKLGDVCTFKGVDRPARTARNPRTGETINVPARAGYPKVVFSKAAKE